MISSTFFASSSERYKLITEKEAHRSQEYWSIMHRAFKESPEGSLIKGAIKEPTDSKYLEHAQRISEGNMLSLDFNDPDFIRNIYKALRFDLINANQLATVTLWYYAVEFFQNDQAKATYNLYSFEEKGPYDPESISYANPKTTADFYQALKALPPNERTYLTVDLPPDHELMYLLITLVRIRMDNNSYVDTYLSFLKHYLQKTDTSKEENHSLLKDFPNLHKKNNIDAALYFLVKRFCLAYPMIHIPEEADADNLLSDIGTALRDAVDTFRQSKLAYTINNYMLFIGNLFVGDQNPSLVISPNYNKKDSTSPLLSIVLPTIPALYALQTAMHKKDTTYPVLTVGKLNTRDILHTLMKNSNLRPVELVHPDVKHNEKPHGVATTPFMLTWHDYFHTWRNGANIYKKIICHLISALQSYKKCDMNKAIWRLTDMDMSLGRIIREHERSGIGFAAEQVEQFCNILLEKNAGAYFFTLLDHDDNNLLIIMDMILNREKWKKYLGAYPEHFLPKDGFAWLGRGEQDRIYVEYHDYKKFQSILLNMKHIILAQPQKDPYRAALFYILSYRLKNNQPGLMKLAQVNSLGVDRFFSWDRNEGIYYRNIHQNKVFIHQHSPEELAKVLSGCLKAEAASAQSERFSIGSLLKRAWFANTVSQIIKKNQTDNVSSSLLRSP